MMVRRPTVTVTLWRHPTTRIYKLRQRVPTEYVKVAEQTIVKISTGEKDEKAARAKLPAVLAKWEAMKADWARKANTVALTPDTAAEIAAKWAAGIVAGNAKADADDAAGVDLLTHDSAADLPAEGKAALERFVDGASRLAGIVVTPESRAVLANALLPVAAAAFHQSYMDSRPPEPGPLARARMALPAVPDAAAAVSFMALFEAWKLVTKIGPVSVSDSKMALNRFEKFLGHDDAARVTKQDVIAYRTHLKQGGLSNSSWNNAMNAIGRVYRQAVEDETLTTDPTAGTRLEPDTRVNRHPYTNDEAVRILTAARNETKKSSLRWSHWLMCFSGMRAGETLQLLGRDIQQENGTPYIVVSEDDPTKSVKTNDRRHIPIHPALIAEGFLDYAATIAPDAPLFPDVPIDKHGRRGGRVWKAIGSWVRDKVGIRDASKAPNHSWRHRFEDELRAVECPEDVRDAIIGHKRQTTGGRNGVRGEALSRLKRWVDKVPVPDGL